MFAKETYINRRNILRSKLKSGIILFPGNSEAPYNYPSNTYHFRQDSTFLYYFGLNCADMVGVMDIEADTDCIYADDYTVDDIIWMGDQPTIKELAAQCGVASTYSLRDLHVTLGSAIAKGRKVHFLPPYRGETILFLEKYLGIKNELIPNYVSKELINAVVSMREIKSAEEVEQIENACEIGYLMHTTAMSTVRPGITERDVAGAIEGVALTKGAGVSFHNIVTQNGQTLHNHYHGNTLESGKILLIDAGAENTMNYCSDFTRSIPINGKYTPLQRDIYNIVLKTYEKAMELIAPNLTYKEVHLSACKVMAEGLKEMGYMRGDVDEAVSCGAHALFMPHGLGHHMGLDVHDMENVGEQYVGYDSSVERSSQFGLASLRMGRALKKGHVLTVEPGIYFIPALLDKWQKETINSRFINYDKVREMLGFGGIRLEDDILVTESGKRILGKHRIPHTPDQIEAFMAK